MKRLFKKVKSYVHLETHAENENGNTSLSSSTSDRTSSTSDRKSSTSIQDIHLQNKKSIGKRISEYQGCSSPTNSQQRRHTFSSPVIFRPRLGSNASATSLKTIPEHSFPWNSNLVTKKNETECRYTSDEKCSENVLAVPIKVEESGYSDKCAKPDVLEDRLTDIAYADEDDVETPPFTDPQDSSGYCTGQRETDNEEKPTSFDRTERKQANENEQFTDYLHELPENVGAVEMCQTFTDNELCEQNAFHNRSNSVSGVDAIYQVRQLRHSESCTAIHVHSSRDVYIDTGPRAYSDSEPTRVGSLPQLWTSYDCSMELKRIRVKTKAQFCIHKKEKRTTQTRAVHDCRKMVETKDGKRTFIVIGNSKDGVSCTGKNILFYLPKIWETLIVVSPSEYIEADVHDNSRKIALFIDNMFGINEFTKEVVEKWAPYFDDMRSAVKNKNVVLVFAMNKRTFEKYMFAENISPHDLFDEAMVIDLTNEYKYTSSEKIEISKHLLETFPGAKRVRFRRFIKDENIDTFRDGDELSISQATLESNVRASTQFGFPQQMKEYSSKKEYLIMRDWFFYYPLDVHYITINNLFESKNERDRESVFAIVIVFENHGEIVKDNLSAYVETASKSKQHSASKTISKRGNHNSKPKSSKLANILADRLEQDHLESALNQGIENLNGWLLQEDNGKVTFSSQLIYNTVAIVSCKLCKEDVIKNAHTEFLYKFVFPSRSLEKTKRIGKLDKYILFSMHTEPETLKIMISRFSNELIKGKRVAIVLGHPLMRQLWFVEIFLKYIKKEAKMSMLLLTLDKDSNMTVLYHGIEQAFDTRREGDPHNFTEYIVGTKKCSFWQENMKDTSFKKRQELSTLKHACKQGNYSTFACFYNNLHPPLDPECLNLAIRASAVEIVEMLLKERFFKEEDLSKEFVYVCKTHCLENPELAKKLVIPIKKRIESVDCRKKCLHGFIQETFRSDRQDLIDFLNEIECSITITKGNPKFGSTASMISVRSHKKKTK